MKSEIFDPLLGAFGAFYIERTVFLSPDHQSGNGDGFVLDIDDITVSEQGSVIVDHRPH